MVAASKIASIKSAGKKPIKQPIFAWEGINKRGEKIKGEMQSTQIALVRAQLRRQGITPKKVYKKSQLFKKKKQKIKAQDIALLSRQLATMINAGVPLAQSLNIISTGHENSSVKALMAEVSADIESGSNLSEALGKHKKYFNDLFCSLVEAGERSGALDVMLEKIATYREKAESIKSKIKKAMFYPAAVVSISFIITAGLLIFIVPKFESIFSNFGAKLPFLTQFILDASKLFQAYWWLIFGEIGCAIWGFITMHRRSYKFARAVDYVLIRLPIFGGILRQAAIARFSRTLATTFAAGLPLNEALTTVAGATGNRLYAEATLNIRDEIIKGMQIQEAMRAHTIFPNMVVQMIAIGEESGSLELMLNKIADYYEQRVDDAVEGLSSLLEPVIMVIIGGLIGTIVIAMYLPIFQMGSVM